MLHVRFINEVCAAFSMDFNLFHDCQECLFTIHLHFPFSACLALFFFLLVCFREGISFRAVRRARFRDITIYALNSDRKKKSRGKYIFINILIRLRRHESRWFQIQIHIGMLYLHKLDNFFLVFGFNLFFIFRGREVKKELSPVKSLFIFMSEMSFRLSLCVLMLR